MGTRKQRRLRQRRRLTQKGGVGENWLNFKYTKRPERRLWANHVYLYGNSIFKAVTEIPWNTYKFKGPALLVYEEEDNNNNEYRLNKEQKTIKELVEVKAKTSPTPYQVIGGAACELWNKIYPKAGNLHKTTDPTADIDIVVAAPIFKAVSEETDDMYPDFQIQLMDDYEMYTPLSEHFSRWLFEQAVGVALKIAPLFEKRQFKKPEPDDTKETKDTDLFTRVGNLLVARVYHDNMIKIQITAKVVESGIERADHLLEFIILTNETIEPKDTLKSTSTNVNGLFIQNVYQLLLSQGKAAVGRADVEPEILYKLINHYGRLLYLTKLLRYTLDNKLQPPLAPWQLASVTKLVTDGLFLKDGICPPPEGCSIQAFLEPLKPYISLNNPVFSQLRKSGFTFSPDA